jgi:tetratricopeptide (TPR) repeat protein
VKIWDLRTRRAVLTLTSSDGPAAAVSFSPDGKRLACALEAYYSSGGSVGGEVRVWDIAASETKDARWQVWMQQQADLGESRREWFAAVFFLDRLIEAEPANSSLYLGRGRIRAEQDQWARAVDDFTRAGELAPKRTEGPYYCALAQLGKGDVAGYRQTCSGLLKEFGSTRDAEKAFRVAFVGVIHPDAVKAAALVRLARSAITLQPTNLQYREILGAAHYRAGDSRAAVERLLEVDKQRRESLKRDISQAVDPKDWVEGQLFLSMAYHHLKQDKQARQWLDRAVKQMAARTSGEGGFLRRPEDVLPSWTERLRWRLLRREAETLIGQPGGDR